MSDWGISDTLDIDQLALAVGYGNIETKYTVSPTQIEIEFSISFPIGDKCTGNIAIMYTFKNQGQLNQNQLALYGELVKVPEMSTWPREQQDGVNILYGIAAAGAIITIGVVASFFMPAGAIATVTAFVLTV